MRTTAELVLTTFAEQHTLAAEHQAKSTTTNATVLAFTIALSTSAMKSHGRCTLTLAFDGFRRADVISVT